jgi:hypothetical protein
MPPANTNAKQSISKKLACLALDKAKKTITAHRTSVTTIIKPKASEKEPQAAPLLCTSEILIIPPKSKAAPPLEKKLSKNNFVTLSSKNQSTATTQKIKRLRGALCCNFSLHNEITTTYSIALRALAQR